jgi:TolB-like protein/Tfp pilus assembly protein PilF
MLPDTLDKGFRFGEFNVAPKSGTVTGPDGERRLEPRVMAVLVELAKRANEVAERSELFAAVWPNQVVLDENLTRAISELRKVFGPGSIKTMPKIGYRLDGQVTEASPKSRDAKKAIAVLPFLDLSPAQDHEYFSDGLSEELLNLLAKISRLRVAARTSSFSFKGEKVDIATVADKLSVDHVLEGSVRIAGKRMRITAQLINARDGYHLWSETYDRTLDDIFAIQDEIAASVVDALKVRLLGETTFETTKTDPEVYALYLQGNHFGRHVTADNIEHANTLYKQALAMDPDYAPAWAGLASNYNNLATDGVLPFDEGFSLAREAANRALAVDPNNAVAYSHLGWIAMWYGHDLAAAAEHYERALALDPANLSIIGNAALLLKGLGRLNEAIALLEYQTVRDPVNPTAHYNLGLGYLSAGRWNDAVVSQDTVLRLSPAYNGAHSFIGTALMMLGDTQAALEAMRQEPSEAYRLLGLVMVQHAVGQADVSDAMLAELIQKYGQERAYNIAYVLAFRKDADRAFEWLDTAVEHGDPGLADIVAEILFGNLHLDPRWAALLKHIKKAPAQLRAIQFDVTLPT